MNLIQIFSIRDAKSETYSKPFYALTKAEAIRNAGDAVNAANDNHLAKYPEDFVLFHLGSFNDSDGMIVPKVPESCVKLVDLVKPKL